MGIEQDIIADEALKREEAAKPKKRRGEETTSKEPVVQSPVPPTPDAEIDENVVPLE